MPKKKKKCCGKYKKKDKYCKKCPAAGNCGACPQAESCEEKKKKK